MRQKESDAAFYEASRAVQQRFEHALEEQFHRYSIYTIPDVTTDSMPVFLSDLFDELTSIGVSPKTAGQFGAGYADEKVLFIAERYENIDCNQLWPLEGRLTFPLRTGNGDIVGFVGLCSSREIGSRWNTIRLCGAPESGSVLFGFDQAKRSARDSFILCEGISEVLALHQNGFDNAVCLVGGLSVTERHAKLMKRYRKAVTILFDNDEFGKRKIADAEKALSDCGLVVKTPFNCKNRLTDLVGLLQQKDGKKLLEKTLYSNWASRNELDIKLKEIFDRYNLRFLIERIACAEECVVELAEYAFDPYSIDGIAGAIESKTGISKKVLIPELKQWNEWCTGSNNEAKRTTNNPTYDDDDFPLFDDLPF